MPTALAPEPTQAPAPLRPAAQGPFHTPDEEAVPPSLPHSCQFRSHSGDSHCPRADLSKRGGGHRRDSKPAGVPLLHAALPQHDESELAANLAS